MKLSLPHRGLAQSVTVEHIGSTSVPGLVEKPIVNLLLGVKHLPPCEAIGATLREVGDYFMKSASVSGRQYWVKRSAHAFNVHVVVKDGTLCNEDLAFRHYLRSYPQAAVAYCNHKKAIYREGAHRLLEYFRKKADLIATICQKLTALKSIL